MRRLVFINHRGDLTPVKILKLKVVKRSQVKRELSDKNISNRREDTPKRVGTGPTWIIRKRTDLTEV